MKGEKWGKLLSGTPNFKIQSNKIKGYRRRFLKVRKTGKVVLSHGEDRGRKPLAEIIEHNYGIKPILPEYGDSVEI